LFYVPPGLSIKEGTKVKATYEPKDGKMVLTKIEIVK
jgi:hypothetical protein